MDDHRAQIEAVLAEWRAGGGHEDDDSAELIVAKHRNGPLGTITLRYRAECVRFEERAPTWRDRDAD